MCKERIESATQMRGVQFVNWDIDTKLFTVKYDTTIVKLAKIESRILEVGHDLENKKADNSIYKALPDCCLFRDKKEGSTNDEHSNKIAGIVLRENAKGKYDALKMANIVWLGTNISTVSDSSGLFSIEKTTQSSKLVISYTGCVPDTIDVHEQKQLMIVMAINNKLTEVVISSKLNATYASLLNPIRIETMTGRELLKAACCNLSESFETNPAVDVSFNDAVTGSKQIQLLGLSGIYTQLTVENMPGPRGLSTPLGLNSIAGPWIDNIQLIKGVGSVANGFESIAGQINVDLKTPESPDRLLANLYVNDIGKTDLNLNFTQQLGEKWSTAFLLHDDWLTNQSDMNRDGFRDLPTGNQFSLINRYAYNNKKGVFAQFGVKILDDQRVAGQLNYKRTYNLSTYDKYGMNIDINRRELFGKLGYVFPQSKYKSIGLQFSTFKHDQQMVFGSGHEYNGVQNDVYLNLIYQSIIGTTKHKFRTGASFVRDSYIEMYKSLPYSRTESVPGAFFEYTYEPNEKITLLGGIRADANNLFGAFVTPRMNLRYQLFKKTTLRASIGRGQRTANIFAENNAVFASERMVEVLGSSAVKGYGLNPEVSWNKGITIDQQYKIFNNKADIVFDYFRNDFVNQIVVDQSNVRFVKFYDLKGPSYSNSFQVTTNLIPIKNITLRLAYRYFDVKQTINGNLVQKPYIAKQRAFASIDYANKHNWKFNYTINYNGPKRLPGTSLNPVPYQRSNHTPSYWLMNAQVSKTFFKKSPMDFYIGAENITNFKQENPIIAANNPFSGYYDASMIWGPITGRMFYVGWRMKIKK
jgi:outer membrane receptor for ferrienterochelin and colicin/copper chaperone CopZ